MKYFLIFFFRFERGMHTRISRTQKKPQIFLQWMGKRERKKTTYWKYESEI